MRSFVGWVVGLGFCFPSLSPEIAALDLIIKYGSVLYQAAQRFLANHISDNSGVWYKNAVCDQV